jgi:hypothetical protein
VVGKKATASYGGPIPNPAGSSSLPCLSRDFAKLTTCGEHRAVARFVAEVSPNESNTGMLLLGVVPTYKVTARRALSMFAKGLSVSPGHSFSVRNEASVQRTPPRGKPRRSETSLVQTSHGPWLRVRSALRFGARVNTRRTRSFSSYRGLQKVDHDATYRPAVARRVTHCFGRELDTARMSRWQ